MRLLLLALVSALALAACGDGYGLADPPTATAPATTTTTTTVPPEERPPVVGVTVGGQYVPLVRRCSGFDGAIVTVAEDGRRIMVVREQGVAIRIGTDDGSYTETDDVEVTTEQGVTTYTGSVVVDGEPTRVVLQAPVGLELEPCPEGSSSS